MEIEIIDIEGLSERFLEICHKSDTKLKNIPKEKDEIIEFLDENYTIENLGIYKLSKDLSKIGITFVISEIQHEFSEFNETHIFNIGDGYCYDIDLFDFSQWSPEGKASVFKNLTKLYNNINSIDLKIYVSGLARFQDLGPRH